MTFIGKNPDFTATWDCARQAYKIYKKGRYLLTVFNFSQANNYLN